MNLQDVFKNFETPGNFYWNNFDYLAKIIKVARPLLRLSCTLFHENENYSSALSFAQYII